MSDLLEAVNHFLAQEPATAFELVEQRLDQILAQKLVEMKKRIQAERFTQFDEAVVEHPGKHNAPVADITHGDDHIGHIEHSQTARGSHHYRVVSYVEAKPDHEHHKTFGSAKSEGHKLVNKHAWSSAIHAEEVNKEEISEGVSGPTRMQLQVAYNSTPAPHHMARISHVEKAFNVHDIKVNQTGDIVHYKHNDKHIEEAKDSEASLRASSEDQLRKSSEAQLRASSEAQLKTSARDGKNKHGYYLSTGVTEAKDPEDRKKEKDRDTARSQERKGKEQARTPLEEEKAKAEYGDRHGEYRVTKQGNGKNVTGHAVYHSPEGRKEVHIGATETLAKAKSHDQQVMAHHDHGPTYHANHEAAYKHIISVHKSNGHGETHEPVAEESLDESHGSGNTTKSGRTKMVRVRVRGGKVQRRKKMSAVKGFKVTKGGTVARMSATERRNRKMGARKGKIKRRAHQGAINRKLHQSLRKRKTMGL